VKVVKKTSERSEIGGRYTLATGLTAGFAVLFALSLLVGGIQGIVISLRQSTLQCNRLESTYIKCELIASGITGTKKTQIFPLVRADIETEISSYDSSKSYRVILVTPNQKYPLITEFYSAPDVEAKASQINAFVRNLSGTSLEVQQKGKWYSFVFGCLFALFGGGAIIFWCSHGGVIIKRT
jgi:hypothetical protein